MQRKRNNPTPPPQPMTLGKAIPVLSVSIIFDALRIMFSMFWFFGPALAAAYCTVKAGPVLDIISNVPLPIPVNLAVKLLGTGGTCSAAATAVGFFGVGVIETFGVVMAMAVGFSGWLAVGLILIISNGRIFKENALWFAASLLISEIPFVGAVPALTVVVWRMYRVQIKIEKEAWRQYEKQKKEDSLQEQNEKIAQENAAHASRVQEQEYADSVAMGEEQETAANDEIYQDDSSPEVA